MVEFSKSKTRENLMRAFAGESQAANRYMLAEKQAIKSKLFVIADLFRFTADQEKVHAGIFYDHLKSEAGSTIRIDGGYPVDISQNIYDLLKMAYHNEYEEFGNVYPNFSQTAREEGFNKIAQDLTNIARIEKSHGKRFERFYSLAEEGRLFSSDKAEKWVCMNCGYIFEGTQVPERCPVCDGEQGYYIRLSMADWGVTE